MVVAREDAFPQVIRYQGVGNVYMFMYHVFYQDGVMFSTVYVRMQTLHRLRRFSCPPAVYSARCGLGLDTLKISCTDTRA